MKTFARVACALALVVGGAGSAYASIQINGTRVIYPAEQREVSLSMVNNSSAPILLQSWVDEGNPKDSPETSKAPFILTPPMSRVDPAKGQTLRIMFTGAALPQDRETVYWLNVLEIPTKPKVKEGDSSNYLQFAIRSRLKLFYRPKGLPGNSFDAIDQVSWRVEKEGSGYVAECTNPTPYFVSFGSLTFKGVGVDKSLEPKGGMCPAKGSEKFPLKGNPDVANGKLTVQVINDYGGFDTHDVPFSR
ncbi:molecular chaperone [Dyella kyungheensis]|jgi:chaperone protein EcpD|uniref:fimbrial biogenesis chaperone n=1 Tax=Dyella kyungheensis TaxID=1242174 RepID=UPI003CF2AC6F